MSIRSPAISASTMEWTSVVTGIFSSRPTSARRSQPSRTPMPRKDRKEVRFALSYDALKMKSTSCEAHTSAIFLAMRQTNFSDSMTHGPRINAGRLPPMLTFRILSDLVFTEQKTDQESRKTGRGNYAFASCFPAFLINPLFVIPKTPKGAYSTRKNNNATPCICKRYTGHESERKLKIENASGL